MHTSPSLIMSRRSSSVSYVVQGKFRATTESSPMSFSSLPDKNINSVGSLPLNVSCHLRHDLMGFHLVNAAAAAAGTEQAGIIVQR